MLNRALLIAVLTASLHLSARVVSSLSYSLPFGSGMVTECYEPEACMALGIKVPFRLVDHYALQLIPGVGEDLAAEIIGSRAIVCAQVRSNPSELIAALTNIKGVGPALARSLASAIDFTESCVI